MVMIMAEGPENSLTVDTVRFPIINDAGISPTVWEQRAGEVSGELAEDDIPGAALAAILVEFVFHDDADEVWRYDGFHWSRRAEQGWMPGTPTGLLRLQQLPMEIATPELNPKPKTSSRSSRLTPLAHNSDVRTRQ